MTTPRPKRGPLPVVVASLPRCPVCSSTDYHVKSTPTIRDGWGTVKRQYCECLNENCNERYWIEWE